MFHIYNFDKLIWKWEGLYGGVDFASTFDTYIRSGHGRVGDTLMLVEQVKAGEAPRVKVLQVLANRKYRGATTILAERTV